MVATLQYRHLLSVFLPLKHVQIVSMYKSFSGTDHSQPPGYETRALGCSYIWGSDSNRPADMQIPTLFLFTVSSKLQVLAIFYIVSSHQYYHYFLTISSIL